MSRINKESIDRFYDYDIYPESRTLYMGSTSSDDGNESGTDYAMAERIIKGLHILDTSAPSGDKPITILMNNLGGDKYHGLAIYDAIKACKNHITIIVFGHAMSMGSIILQAADKRIMTPHSKIMIHYGTWGSQGHPKATYRWAEEGKRYDAIMESLYMEKILLKQPDFKVKRLKEMLDFDTFFTAQEAIDFGLIDEILL